MFQKQCANLAESTRLEKFVPLASSRERLCVPIHPETVPRRLALWLDHGS
jgi:hypothetical protein